MNRFTTEQTLKVLGCTLPFLKDLTRTKEKRPPLFVPSWPATGSGNRTHYSFKDWMILGMTMYARKAELQRTWVEHFIGMANSVSQNKDTLNPFHTSFLSDHAPDAFESDEVRAIFTIAINESQLIEIFDFSTNETDKQEMGFVPVWTVRRLSPGTGKRFDVRSDDSLSNFVRNAPISFSINLKTIHMNIKKSAEKHEIDI